MHSKHNRHPQQYLFIKKQIRNLQRLIAKINFLLVFFVTLFLIACLSLINFQTTKTTHYHNENIPKLEIHNFTLDRFDNTQVNMQIKADSAKQLNDKEIFYNFFANKINEDNTIESLSGKEVWHIEDIYNFIQGINYTKTPNIKFFSEKGMYNQKSEVFIGQGNFLLEDVNLNTTGQDIFYNKIDDTIKAKNIHAKILNF